MSDRERELDDLIDRVGRWGYTHNDTPRPVDDAVILEGIALGASDTIIRAVTGASPQRIYRLRNGESALDRAIIAYRADPTPENHDRLMTAQREHVEGFYRAMAEEYVGRTTDGGAR